MIVALSLAVNLTASKLRAKVNKNRLKRLTPSKREVPPAAAAVVENDPALSILEGLAGKIPLEQFQDDPFLVQTIDRVNSFTSYRTPYKLEGKEDDVVYERSSNDKDKDVIVLNRNEDKINRHSTKQTYVVLRKNPKSISPAYYVTYAYLR